MAHSTIVQEDWRSISGTDTADLPEHISPAFHRLIAAADTESAAALRRQVVKTALENTPQTNEIADPLGEAQYCVTPYLVHQYPNRVLLLTTGRCISYCRYCFRREFTARSSGFIATDQIETVAEYLEKKTHIKEILVSGGDPMSGTYPQLRELLHRIRCIRSDLIIRLCTRAPIFAPELFTPELIALLQQVRPLWLIPHINHPAELGTEQVNALTVCINSGIPVQSQTVLLRHVNDCAEILAVLFHRLTCLGVKPGYLFQTDMARGTADFRVPLSRAAEIWKELTTKLSGLSLPQFVVDLPAGGGKFPLSALIVAKAVVEPLSNNTFSARGLDGKIYRYPL